MKEQYYTPETIDLRSAEFLRELSTFRDKYRGHGFVPQHAALLVIDMQDFFLQPHSHAFVPSMPAIVPKVKQLQDFFLQHGLPVIQTCHSNTSQDCGQMGAWWGSLLAADDPLCNIAAELRHPQALVIPKTQYDAFWKTQLAETLCAQGVTQLVITGVMAHLCCETTARAAFVRGFEVFFAIDGTATYNSNFHAATLLNLAHGFALPVLTAELMSGR